MVKNKKVVSVLLLLTLISGMPSWVFAATDDDGIKEVGTDWQGAYRTNGCQYENLTYTKENAEKPAENLETKNKWTWKFNWYESLAAEIDMKSHSFGGYDNIWADAVDLFIWAGHGPYPNIHFWTNHSTEGAPSANLARTEVRWGDLDMEWAALFTCSFLRHNSDEEFIKEIGPMQNGVHLIQGFATSMYIVNGQGQTYYNHLTGSGLFTTVKTVKQAWFETASYWQPKAARNNNYDGTIIARIIGATASGNDYIWGYGSQSSDPAPYPNDNYSYWSLTVYTP